MLAQSTRAVSWYSAANGVEATHVTALGVDRGGGSLFQLELCGVALDRKPVRHRGPCTLTMHMLLVGIGVSLPDFLAPGLSGFVHPNSTVANEASPAQNPGQRSAVTGARAAPSLHCRSAHGGALCLLLPRSVCLLSSAGFLSTKLALSILLPPSPLPPLQLPRGLLRHESALIPLDIRHANHPSHHTVLPESSSPPFSVARHPSRNNLRLPPPFATTHPTSLPLQFPPS